MNIKPQKVPAGVASVEEINIREMTAVPMLITAGNATLEIMTSKKVCFTRLKNDKQESVFTRLKAGDKS